jgi:uncharacterized protein
LHPQSTRQRERAERPREAPMSLERLSKLTSIRSISPAYFTVADHPWLRALLDERERFVGQKRRDWKVRISEPLSVAAPQWKLNVALGVLDRLSRDKGVGSVSPRRIRSVVFHQAATEPDRAKVLARAAVLLDLPSQSVMAELLADLPDERTLAPLPAPVAPTELSLACNAALVASLLSRALRVRIVARGQVRAVVRHVRLMGLLCHAVPGETKDEVVLEISGPFALFRHTRIYGRALSSLVPRLTWCNSYRLEADSVLGDGTSVGRLVLSSGDPIAPARELASFDSKVEERFAREFGRLARDWDVVREPAAIEVGDGLIFPDFELRHRMTGERWLLEIVGYWTAGYVRRKLSALRAARIDRLIVCIDEERCCGEEPLELDAWVVRYRRKVDPRAVLEIVDPEVLKGWPQSPQMPRAEAPAKSE